MRKLDKKRTCAFIGTLPYFVCSLSLCSRIKCAYMGKITTLRRIVADILRICTLINEEMQAPMVLHLRK
jgi:hypothetical protein